MRFVAKHPLAKERRIAALQRLIWWQIASRRNTELLFEWIEGAQLAVRRGMTGATGNIYCGLHEFVEMAFLLHLLKPDDLFVDVGANVGSYTVLASAVCGAKTIALEPDPEAARSLRRNIDVNHLEELAAVLEIAAGAENHDVAFTIGMDTMNRVADQSDSKIRIVPMRRLDDIKDISCPTLIKLDVEGFEAEAIVGAAGLLAQPSLLAVESETRSQTVIDSLKSFGFVRTFYDPFTRSLASDSFGYHAWNALFMRDLSEIAKRTNSAPIRRVAGVAI